MTADTDPGEPTRLSPEEALSVLGDETRLQILRTLGRADEPLAFSELYVESQCETSANFSYHLGRLTGHFVHETVDGYVLRQAGRRVIEAVLAEAPGHDVRVERTRVDWPCFLCGDPVEVSYRDEHVGLYCSGCGGTRNETSTTAEGRAVGAADVLGYLHLPPAGIVDRTPVEVLRTALFWTTSGALALAREICPRCSAPLDTGVRVCEDHDATDGHCGRCGQRFGVVIRQTCTNCIFTVKSPFVRYLLDDVDLIRFMIEHGVDPLAVDGFHLSGVEETVLSTDPFEAKFTFTADGDALALTVDDDLAVVDVSRHVASESD